MAYVASLYKGGRVVAALTANFLSPDELNLVVARKDGIDIYRIEEDAQSDPDAMTDLEFEQATRAELKCELSTDFYDTITTMEKYRPNSQDTDCILLSTGEFAFFSLRYDRKNKVIVNEHAGKDIAQAHTEEADVPMARKDPGGRMVGLYLHKGLFIALPFWCNKKGMKPVSLAQAGRLDDPVYLRFSQFHVLDMIFLHGCMVPTLAMLCAGPGLNSKPIIYTYEVNVDNKGGWLNQEKLHLDYSKLGLSTCMLIPVPEPYGGFLIAGTRRICYKSPNLSDKTLITGTLPEAFELTTYTAIDKTRFIVGDRIGSMFDMKLVTEGSKVVGIESYYHGTTSIPHRYVALPNGRLFVASQVGDHQLVQTHGPEKQLEVLQEMRNLAPILDLVAPDLGYSQDRSRSQYSPDQTRLVAASGFYHNGAFKSIRNGVHSETIVELEMPGVQSVFPIGDRRNIFDKYLLVSFLTETRVFEISEEGFLEKEDFFGFNLSVSTIFTLRTKSRLAQVTSEGVSLYSEQEGLVGSWKAPNGESVTFATGNEDCLLVVLSGKTLINLNLRNANITPRKRKTFLGEISCLTVPKCEPDICIVGFWGGAGVMILDMENFAILTSDLLSERENGAIPRSIVLTPLVDADSPTLLVGMADGTLYSFSFTSMDKSISNSKKIYLSDDPIGLFEIPRTDDLNGVFAACGQSSIIYGSHGHLVYSTSSHGNARFAAPIRTKELGNCVAVAFMDGLNIEKFATDRSIHTTSYPVGAIVRRMVHWKEKRIIVAVLSMIDTHPTTKQDVNEGSVKIFDDAEFGVYDSYDLRSMEIPETISLVKVPDENGKLTDMIAVGTCFVTGEGDSHPEMGRLLLFELVNDKKLRVVLEQDLGVGAIRSIEAIEGRLVLGSALHVCVYTISGSMTLTQEAIYRPFCEVVELSVFNRMIAVGDIMKGPALIEYVPKTEKEATKTGLIEHAITFLKFFTSSLQLLDENTILASDCDKNLGLFRRPESSTSESEIPQLEVIAWIRLEQTVNRITRLDFPEPSFSDDTNRDLFPISPYAHLGTADGRIYIFALIKSKYVEGLLELQDGLAETTKVLGYLNFNEYRGEQETKKPFRFVDGDFLRKLKSEGGTVNVPEKAIVKVEEKHRRNVGRALEGLARFMGI